MKNQNIVYNHVGLVLLTKKDEISRKLVVQAIANDLFSLKEGVDRTVY